MGANPKEAHKRHFQTNYHINYHVNYHINYHVHLTHEPRRCRLYRESQADR